MKNIILSADDFGRSPQRNAAIDYAMKNGIIKSAALLVNTEYTAEAVEMAHEGGWIEFLHCHLNLVSGEISGNSHPLNTDFAKCDAFCVDGEFRKNGDYNFYNHISFKYANQVFRELEAQYKRFIELTDNKGNNQHIDFHLYYNLNFPVAYAMRKLIKKYNIKTVRYFGEHQRLLYGKKMRLKLFMIKLLGVKGTDVAKSCNIDFYLTKKELFSNDKYVELYVHPDYIDGQLIDNSISSFGNKMRTLQENYNLICNDANIISWNDIC